MFEYQKSLNTSNSQVSGKFFRIVGSRAFWGSNVADEKVVIKILELVVVEM